MFPCEDFKKVMGVWRSGVGVRRYLWGRAESFPGSWAPRPRPWRRSAAGSSLCDGSKENRQSCRSPMPAANMKRRSVRRTCLDQKWHLTGEATVQGGAAGVRVGAVCLFKRTSKLHKSLKAILWMMTMTSKKWKHFHIIQLQIAEQQSQVGFATKLVSCYKGCNNIRICAQTVYGLVSEGRTRSSKSRALAALSTASSVTQYLVMTLLWSEN